MLRPLAAHSTGPLLVEDPAIAKYYLPSGQPVAALVQHPQHHPASGASTGTHATAGIIAAGNAATFAYYIAHGYFAYVALNFTDTTGWTTAWPPSCTTTPATTPSASSLTAPRSSPSARART